MFQIKPQFQSVLVIPEDHIDNSIVSGQSALTKCTVPVYTAGVLAVFNDVSNHHNFQPVFILSTYSMITLIFSPPFIDGGHGIAHLLLKHILIKRNGFVGLDCCRKPPPYLSSCTKF